MADSYGALWQFKEHVATWSFGVNRWKDYVYLRYRPMGETTYLPWNLKEKVVLIEDHHENYVVITLQEVDDSRKETAHCHLIVIDVHSFHRKFDIDNLVTFLEGSQMESLNAEFDKLGYIPWQNGTAKSNAKRLRLIWQTLYHYALQAVEKQPTVGRSISRGHVSESNVSRPSLSAGTSGGSRGTRLG